MHASGSRQRVKSFSTTGDNLAWFLERAPARESSTLPPDSSGWRRIGKGYTALQNCLAGILERPGISAALKAEPVRGIDAALQAAQHARARAAGHMRVKP